MTIITKVAGITVIFLLTLATGCSLFQKKEEPVHVQSAQKDQLNNIERELKRALKDLASYRDNGVRDSDLEQAAYVQMLWKEYACEVEHLPPDEAASFLENPSLCLELGCSISYPDARTYTAAGGIRFIDLSQRYYDYTTPDNVRSLREKASRKIATIGLACRK